MIRAKVNGCAALSANSFQGGSPNQQSNHSSQSQSSDQTEVNSGSHNGESSQPSQHNCHNTVPKYLDTNLSHIERVVLEIVETERQYVNDLHQIIQVSIHLSLFHLIYICFTFAFNSRDLKICIQFSFKSCVEHRMTSFTEITYFSFLSLFFETKL